MRIEKQRPARTSNLQCDTGFHRSSRNCKDTRAEIRDDVDEQLRIFSLGSSPRVIYYPDFAESKVFDFHTVLHRFDPDEKHNRIDRLCHNNAGLFSQIHPTQRNSKHKIPVYSTPQRKNKRKNTAMSSPSPSPTKKVLVVGATGATGKHVVRMLLDKGDTTVVAVTRSSAKLLGLLNAKDETEDNLIVREVASLSDLTATDLSELTDGCTAIVSCLGHNLTFKGMYKDGQFLTAIVRKLTASMPPSCRFVLMGSDGVSHDGDAPRSRAERVVLWLLRYLVPPHADNEGAARCLRESPSSLKYCVARPGDLTDDETDAKGYEVLDRPRGSLFGGDSTSRMQVADCLVDLATMDAAVFDAERNRTMPVVYSIPKEEEEEDGGSKKTK